jgi:hypothetical protein
MLNKIDIKHSKKIIFNNQEITIIKRPKGLGDSLESFLHNGLMGKIVHKLTGLDEPCNKCKERKRKLNELIPYN